MKKFVFTVCKRLFFIWMLWSSFLTVYESIKLKIPQNMCIYEEQALTVLSESDKKISPEQLNLDFTGNIQVNKTVEGTYQACCNLLGMIPLKTMEIQVVEKKEVIPGGIPVGIYVETDGIFVIGTGKVETSNGQLDSPAKKLIRTGDYIVSLQGERIQTKEELVEKLAELQEEEVVLGVRRKQEEIQIAITPRLYRIRRSSWNLGQR